VIAAGCAPNQQANGTMPVDLQRLQQMATNGNAGAANALGIIYANGTRVPQDFAEARKWFQLGSEHGNAASEMNLGILYMNGRGTPVDLNEGMRWFRSAADHGNA